MTGSLCASYVFAMNPLNLGNLATRFTRVSNLNFHRVLPPSGVIKELAGSLLQLAYSANLQSKAGAPSICKALIKELAWFPFVSIVRLWGYARRIQLSEVVS